MEAEVFGTLIIIVVIGVIIKFGRRGIGNNYNARYDADPNPPLVRRRGGRHPYRAGRHDIMHCKCKGRELGEEGCIHKKANFDYNMRYPARVVNDRRRHLLGLFIVIAIMVIGYYYAYTQHLL